MEIGGMSNPRIRAFLSHSGTIALSVVLLVFCIISREPRICYALGLLVVMAQFSWGNPGGVAACILFSVVGLVIAMTANWAGYHGSLAPFWLLPVFFSGVWGVASYTTGRFAGQSIRLKLAQEESEQGIVDIEEEMETERRRIAAGRQRIDKIFNLTKFTRQLSSFLGLTEVIEQVLSGTNELTGHLGKPSLVMFEEDSAMVYRLEEKGVVAAREEADPFSLWVRVRVMPLYIPDLVKDVRFRTYVPTTTRSIVATPLLRERAVMGVLLVQSSSADSFSQEDWRLLSLMGDLSAVAIQNSLLYQRTQEEAITDGLTGVFVHRHFHERLAEEVKRCSEVGSNLTMIMADIDNFKSLNDTYGHLTGDIVLKGVAHALLDGVRTSDFVARYGGEEFAILLTETDAVGGMLVAERLRSAVENCSFAAAGVERRVTISVGVASIEGGGGEGRNLVERADEALYEAKHAGKNRVVQSRKTA